MLTLDNNQFVQIFYDRICDKKYLPFDLYIYPIFDILKKITENIEFIHNIDDIKQQNQNILLIMFLNDLGKYVNKYGFNIKSNIKIIFIHADFILNHSTYDQQEIIKFINYINYNKCYIWEYSSQNIFYYNTYLKNIKYYFLPLLYDKSIETFYNSKLTNSKINWKDKDIEVVFLGDYSDRRKTLFENIKKRYNTVIITNNNNYEEIVNLIERSKIFVNVFSKDQNKAFDYFRLALLYSNKVFVITETPKVNFQIETNLLELKNIIVTSNSENILNKIDEYINKTDDEIKIITTKTYDIFSKHSLQKYVLNFFK